MSNDKDYDVDYEDFGFGEDDDKFQRREDKFKGKDNETYRLSFGWWSKNEDGTPNYKAPTPKFRGILRVYVAGVGPIACPKGGPARKELERLAGQEAKLQVGTIIVKWPVNLSTGKPDMERIKRGEGIEVLPWVFSNDKYQSLLRKFDPDDSPAKEYDLKATCQGSKYQKWDFGTAKTNLLIALAGKDTDGAKALVKTIEEQIQEAVDPLNKFLGKKLTPAQVKERLGVGGAASGGGGGGGGGAGVDTEGMEEMLDDLGI